MYNKYHSKKVNIDGITFDSKKEANSYCELKLLEKAGEIDCLKRQYQHRGLMARWLKGQFTT